MGLANVPPPNNTQRGADQTPTNFLHIALEEREEYDRMQVLSQDLSVYAGGQLLDLSCQAGATPHLLKGLIKLRLTSWRMVESQHYQLNYETIIITNCMIRFGCSDTMLSVRTRSNSVSPNSSTAAWKSLGWPRSISVTYMM